MYIKKPMAKALHCAALYSRAEYCVSLGLCDTAEKPQENYVDIKEQGEKSALDQIHTHV